MFAGKGKAAAGKGKGKAASGGSCQDADCSATELRHAPMSMTILLTNAWIALRFFCQRQHLVMTMLSKQYPRPHVSECPTASYVSNSAALFIISDTKGRQVLVMGQHCGATGSPHTLGKITILSHAAGKAAGSKRKADDERTAAPKGRGRAKK